MRRWIHRLFTRLALWMQRSSQIAQFENIGICEFNPPSPTFKRVLLAAFQLLKDTDPRRYARVKRHLDWVSNEALSNPGAEYRHHTRTCSIDYVEPESESEIPFWIAEHASTLVHEATHGVLLTRGIRYSPELRARIERLCVTEQNRFARRLSSTHPEIAERLHREFDESHWHPSWNTTNTGRFFAVLRRIHTRRHK